MRHGENLLGDALQLLAPLRVEALGRYFSFDDRDGVRNTVSLKDFTAQHLACKWRSGNFCLGGEGISVHMGEQQAPAIFRGDVRHGKISQSQRLLQHRKGVDHPA